VSPPAGCARLPWDSQFFGLQIGRIDDVCREPQLLRDARDWARAEQLDCVYALLDGAEPLLVRHASELGFKLVDLRVTLRAAIEPTSRATPLVREALDADLPALRTIASYSHQASRFYADPGFALERCDALYAEWIERSVRRDFADAVLVATEGSLPLGYLTCSVDPRGIGQIGLFAVAREARGRGYGAQLVHAAFAWFRDRGLREASVVAQGNNARALAVYQRHGFATDKVELWHHGWPKLRP